MRAADAVKTWKTNENYRYLYISIYVYDKFVNQGINQSLE